MNEPTLPLGSTCVRNRIAELGLKPWWLAEPLGVARRTVMRRARGQLHAILAARAQGPAVRPGSLYRQPAEAALPGRRLT